jgi:hypothetical protein
MRDIWIRDAEGVVRYDLAGGGLASDVWKVLYPVLSGDPRRPVLARLWREQWGPGADASLSRAEVARLATELESLAPDLPADLPAAAARFLHDLATLCERALEQGGGLELIAD